MNKNGISDNHNPALAYTLEKFVNLGSQDELTYNNFSILSSANNITYTDQCILDYYIDDMKNSCKKVTELSSEEINKYKYRPDLLAYDVYGSTQLDFIVLLCNGIIDPKEFDFKKKYLMLPTKQYLNSLLSTIYSSESDWIDINRENMKKTSTSKS